MDDLLSLSVQVCQTLNNCNFTTIVNNCNYTTIVNNCGCTTIKDPLKENLSHPYGCSNEKDFLQAVIKPPINIKSSS